MDLLISDHGKAEISNRIKEILSMYVIDDFQSKPHQKNQKFFKGWWQVIKRLTITILVLEYVVYIRNRTASGKVIEITPLEKLTRHVTT